MSSSPNYPVDLILVRHGESEDKLAGIASRLGDDSLWDKLKNRHPSYYRLTSHGVDQAKVAGAWIKENIVTQFDRYYTSEYIRALETAAEMDFSHAKWATEIYLREQDEGVLTGQSDMERERHFAEEMARRKRDAFYFAPVGGESVARVASRIEMWLGELQRACAGMKVLAVVHRSIMQAVRIRLERMRQSDWPKFREDPEYKVVHGQIVHYSRRNPETGEISSKMCWVRTINPDENGQKMIVGDWKRIIRAASTKDELFALVLEHPRLVDNKEGLATKTSF